MKKTAEPRFAMVLAAAALVGIGGLLGASGSRETGATLVGITATGEDGEMLVRLWSDGTCEYARVFGGAPARLIEDWKPLD